MNEANSYIFSKVGINTEKKYKINVKIKKLFKKLKKNLIQKYSSLDLDCNGNSNNVSSNNNIDFFSDEKIHKEKNLNKSYQDKFKNIFKNIKKPNYIHEDIFNSNIHNIKKKKNQKDYVDKTENQDKKILDKIDINCSKNRIMNPKLSNKKFSRTNSFYDKDKYKYYRIHIEKLEKYKKLGLFKKIINENKNDYFPKFDLIYKKIPSGPVWDQLTSRKLNIISNYQPRPNISRNESYLLETKRLNSIDKQNQRNRLPINKNKRERNKNNFSPLFKKINLKINRNKNLLNKKNISFNLKDIKNIFKTKIKLNKNNKGKLIPNFKLCLSREKINKIKNTNKFGSKSVLSPNYNSIEENAKVMIKFNKKDLSKKKRSEFKGINFHDYYDFNKEFYILKNNSFTINFDKMTSRVNDRYLPSYMKGIYTRTSSEERTYKSLKMNNYSNGNFLDLNNSYEKKSYNKYINLCKMISDNFHPEFFRNESEFNLLARKIKQPNLSNFDIERILDRIKMKRFDKITYKSLNYNY